MPASFGFSVFDPSQPQRNPITGELILDENGQPIGRVVIRIGELGLGTGKYGIASINDQGLLVALDALSHGQRTAKVSPQENVGYQNNVNYTDCPTPGPAVEVEIGPTGRAKVTVTAQLNYSTTVGNSYVGGAMSFAITGATTVAPNDDDALLSRLWNNGTSTGVQQKTKASYSTLVTGLNPGNHLFTAKYRSMGSGTPALPALGNANVDGCNFEDRRIWVEPF